MRVLAAALLAALGTFGCGNGEGVAPGDGGAGGADGTGGAGGEDGLTFTVSVDVEGLSGTLVLQNNGGDDLSTIANGRVAFDTPLPEGATYAVTVQSSPPLQGCTVQNGEGMIAGADVADIVARCDYVPFFQAADGQSGTELWRTDGTEEGTQRVKDIWPGPNGSSPDPMLRVGELWFFRADDGVHGSELWASDGTEDGTRMVLDIRSGPDGSSPQGFAALDGLLFFAANDGTGGQEVWMTDGTEAGTRTLIDEGPAPITPRDLTAVGDVLYFEAADEIGSRELWKTDGTSSSTAIVREITAGRGSSRIGELVALGGVLFFRATINLNLWRSEGTFETTNQVSAATAFVQELTVVGDELLFSGDDAAGQELWKSDGTDAGTTRVADINPNELDSRPDWLTEVAGQLFFSADDGANGRELWKSDGTLEGTVLVRDIQAGGDSVPEHLSSHEGRLYFRADDGIHGLELWASAGTEETTVLLSDIWEGDMSASPVPINDGVDTFGVFQDVVLFFADDGERGLELWKSSGTQEGTVLVKDINPGAGAGKQL